MYCSEVIHKPSTLQDDSHYRQGSDSHLERDLYLEPYHIIVLINDHFLDPLPILNNSYNKEYFCTLCMKVKLMHLHLMEFLSFIHRTKIDSIPLHFKFLVQRVDAAIRVKSQNSSLCFKSNLFHFRGQRGQKTDDQNISFFLY